MPRKPIAAAIVAGGVLLAYLLLRPSPASSDEAQIRALFRDAAEKASARDISGVMEHVAPDYRGEGGDRDELKRYLLGYTLRAEWVQALEKVDALRIENDRAEVTLIVLLVRAQ
ncbi:MAG: hypothetical protein ACK4N5_19935, partial [Myxococcales bacterium]